MFKPKRRVAHHINFGDGAIMVDFYTDEKHPDGNYMHIYSPQCKFEQKIQGFTFGYLLTAVKQGNESEVKAYCAMLWRVTQEIYQDKEFCDAIVKAINDRDKRLFKKGADNAAEVTEAQDMADQALMTGIAREADKKAQK